MHNKVTLILGDEQDEHALHVFEHLRQASIDVEILNSRWFPESLGIAFDPHSGQWRVDLPGGRRLASPEIASVYWRTYEGVADVLLPDAHQRFIAHNDARSLFESFLIHLPVRWINGWSAFQLHQTKPVQLARVTKLGIRTPATRWTNAADEVLLFAAQQGKCIYKPVQGGDQTRALDPQHLTRKNLESLRAAPITVQEAIPGTNIRVFVAGERVVACEVNTASLDYREAADVELLQHRLPQAVEHDCRRLASALDLVWTGIDFRLTPQGDYVFLEANPSPMFLGFEAATGLPLTQLLVDLLLSK